LVQNEIQEQLGKKVRLTIRQVQDFRNYKVNFEKARNVLSFHPRHDVRTIVRHLIKNMDRFADWDNPEYYNVQVFHALESAAAALPLVQSVEAGAMR
jgi:hypothetical protein